jgi:DNA-binding NtrC family response regulator
MLVPSDDNGEHVPYCQTENPFPGKLRDRFEMNDFDVEAAYDNDTALCLIQKRKYDLIMQNMNRPFGNCLVDSNEKWAGVAFYRKYISTISPEVPVIFYSAHIHELPKDILKSNLCTGLKIPFDLTELLDLIESILDQPKQISSEQ